MYISIGGEVVIKSKDLIAILDHQIIHESAIMEEFIKKYTDNDMPTIKNSYKSIVITAEEVYFSPLSSSTLIKRSN